MKKKQIVTATKAGVTNEFPMVTWNLFPEGKWGWTEIHVEAAPVQTVRPEVPKAVAKAIEEVKRGRPAKIENDVNKD